MIQDLFGAETIVLETTKVKGKHYVQPMGYIAQPGTGPARETCRSCQHYYLKRMGNTYPKCNLNRVHWTGGRRSDILARSPACSKWEHKE